MCCRIRRKIFENVGFILETCPISHCGKLATAEDLHNPELTAEDSTIMDSDDNVLS